MQGDAVRDEGDPAPDAGSAVDLDDFDVVEIFDAGEEPLPDDAFEGYDVVLLSAIDPYLEPDRLGDLLADYVDDGGGVVLTLNAMSEGWEVGGRFRDDGYSPFRTGDTTLTPSRLGEYDTEHPIMQGVEEIRGEFLAILPVAVLIAR